jgi:hypothetical protein
MTSASFPSVGGPFALSLPSLCRCLNIQTKKEEVVELRNFEWEISLQKMCLEKF